MQDDETRYQHYKNRTCKSKFALKHKIATMAVNLNSPPTSFAATYAPVAVNSYSPPYGASGGQLAFAATTMFLTRLGRIVIPHVADPLIPST